MKLDKNVTKCTMNNLMYSVTFGLIIFETILKTTVLYKIGYFTCEYIPFIKLFL